MNNPYSVLGLQNGASDEEIKSAFRKMAMQYHPDRNPAGAAKFQEINQAYEELTKPQQRQEQPFDMDEMLRQHFGQTFDHFFRRKFNADLNAGIEITLEQAYSGCEIELSTGSKQIRLKLPAGVDTGQRMKVQGEGSHQSPNEPPGDLYLHIKIRPHDRFIRQGYNLIMEAQIDALDAIIGGSIKLFGIDNKELNVAFHSGIQPGEKIVVSGEGMNIDSYRGDLIVIFNVHIPRADQFTEHHIEIAKKIMDFGARN